VEKLQNKLQEKEEFKRRDNKLQNETEAFKGQSDLGTAMEKCSQ
jgi:hypothetical protein